ncbi:MAG: hypothetical protein KDE24_08920, partial [Caldilinea sp.]|nr:hypothetical protein [Caldilinea sp.]
MLRLVQGAGLAAVQPQVAQERPTESRLAHRLAEPVSVLELLKPLFVVEPGQFHELYRIHFRSPR